MTDNEIKKFIAERVAKGVSLSQIQDELASERKVRLTFMELRLLAAEIDSTDWTKLDKPEQAEAKVLPGKPGKGGEAGEEAELPEEELPGEGAPEGGAGTIDDEAEESPAEDVPAAPEAPAADDSKKVRGKTTVQLSKVAVPGTVASGTVKFGSGASAEWYLDQMGRLGLGKLTGGKPDRKDVEEFQVELQKLIGGE